VTELNYLVKIDNEGKLRWTRNNELVDTSAGHWKDAGGGQGIIAEEVPMQTENGPPREGFDSVPSVSANNSQFSEQENDATHYVSDTKGKTKLARLIRRHLTIHGIMDRLLRKAMQRNTWIYVSDKHCKRFKAQFMRSMSNG
jgi:hypothetical protein